MTKYFLKLVKSWKHLLLDKDYRISFLIGWIWMFAALYVNMMISTYNDTFVTSGVGDLILDNIPTIDLNFFYTVGIYVIIVSLLAYTAFHPAIVPFGLKTFAIFILVRSFFIVLTHIGPPEGYFALAGPDYDSHVMQKFFYLNDLFFSAHTGIPFLAFLYLRGHLIRYFYLIASFVMGATVLLMHVHYSIDVFGAYFITYSIYHLSDSVFNKLNMSFKGIVKAIEKRERKNLRDMASQRKDY